MVRIYEALVRLAKRHDEISNEKVALKSKLHEMVAQIDAYKYDAMRVQRDRSADIALERTKAQQNN